MRSESDEEKSQDKKPTPNQTSRNLGAKSLLLNPLKNQQLQTRGTPKVTRTPNSVLGEALKNTEISGFQVKPTPIQVNVINLQTEGAKAKVEDKTKEVDNIDKASARNSMSTEK